MKQENSSLRSTEARMVRQALEDKKLQHVDAARMIGRSNSHIYNCTSTKGGQRFTDTEWVHLACGLGFPCFSTRPKLLCVAQNLQTCLIREKYIRQAPLQDLYEQVAALTADQRALFCEWVNELVDAEAGLSEGTNTKE